MSKDAVYHGKRARAEISAAFHSVTARNRNIHFEIARLHLDKMRSCAGDAIDRLEANCVAAILLYWERRFSEASGQVSGAEMLARLRRQPFPVPAVPLPQPQPASGPMFFAAMA